MGWGQPGPRAGAFRRANTGHVPLEPALGALFPQVIGTLVRLIGRARRVDWARRARTLVRTGFDVRDCWRSSPARLPPRGGDIRSPPLDRAGENTSALVGATHLALTAATSTRPDAARQRCTCRILKVAFGVHRDAHRGIRDWRAWRDARPPLGSTSASGRQRMSPRRGARVPTIDRNVERAPRVYWLAGPTTLPVRKGAQACGTRSLGRTRRR
jgi:hypothetical protein